jgi:hypothetical protein
MARTSPTAADVGHRSRVRSRQVRLTGRYHCHLVTKAIAAAAAAAAAIAAARRTIPAVPALRGVVRCQLASPHRSPRKPSRGSPRPPDRHDSPGRPARSSPRAAGRRPPGRGRRPPPPAGACLGPAAMPKRRSSHQQTSSSSLLGPDAHADRADRHSQRSALLPPAVRESSFWSDCAGGGRCRSDEG